MPRCNDALRTVLGACEQTCRRFTHRTVDDVRLHGLPRLDLDPDRHIAVYPASMSNAPAWTSAGVALLAFLSASIFGYLNLQRAKRGPQGTVRWALDRESENRVALINTGSADAFDVRVEIATGSRVDGETAFDVFAIGQRASYLVLKMWGDTNNGVQVTWSDKKRKKSHEWRSDLP